MKHSDVESLIITIDELIFSHTGEHLDDLQHEILEGIEELIIEDWSQSK